MKILDRLKKLEQRRTESHAAIFFGIYDHALPSGWHYVGKGGERVNIMRLPDETDESLRGRAAAACRADCAGTTPILFQIDEHWENVGGFILPKVQGEAAWGEAAAEQQDELIGRVQRCTVNPLLTHR